MGWSGAWLSLPLRVAARAVRSGMAARGTCRKERESRANAQGYLNEKGLGVA